MHVLTYKTKIYAKRITMFTTSCLGCQQFFFISNEAICPPFIFVRDSLTAEEERISLIKPNVDLNYLLTSMPNIFNSGGLSEERKLYSVIQTCTAILQ